MARETKHRAEPDAWEEVVNPLRPQTWMLFWMLLCGYLVVRGTYEVLTLRSDDPSRGAWAFGLVLGLVGYPLGYFFGFWWHIGAFFFAADRVGVRTLIETVRRTPPRVFPLTPDLTFVFAGTSAIGIRTAHTWYAISALFYTQDDLRRLVEVLERRHIPVECHWKPRFMKLSNTRNLVDRFTGPPL